MSIDISSFVIEKFSQIYTIYESSELGAVKRCIFMHSKVYFYALLNDSHSISHKAMFLFKYACFTWVSEINLAFSAFLLIHACLKQNNVV